MPFLILLLTVATYAHTLLSNEQAADEPTTALLKALDDDECGEAIRIFAEAGGDVNAMSEKGTPLIIEVSEKYSYDYYCGFLRIKTLLELGADPKQKGFDGENLLLLYMDRNSRYYHYRLYPPIVKLLLDAGVNPAEKDSKGRSALWLALKSSPSRINSKMSKEEKEIQNMIIEAVKKMGDETANNLLREALAQNRREMLLSYLPLLLAFVYIGFSVLAREKIYRSNPNSNWVPKVNAVGITFAIGVGASLFTIILTFPEAGIALFVSIAVFVVSGLFLAIISRTFNKDGYLYYGSSLLATTLLLALWWKIEDLQIDLQILRNVALWLFPF